MRIAFSLIGLCLAITSVLGQQCSETGEAVYQRDISCRNVKWCVEGRIYDIVCKDNLLWSNIAKTCVPPNHPFEDCNKETHYVYPVVYHKQISNDPRCQIADGDNPDEEFCDVYVSCFNRTSLSRRICPVPLRWHIGTRQCEFPGRVNCNGKGDFNDTPLKTDICNGRTGVSAKPEDCRYFIECPTGDIKACAPGTFFSNTYRQCLALLSLSAVDRQQCRMAA